MKKYITILLISFLITFLVDIYLKEKDSNRINISLSKISDRLSDNIDEGISATKFLSFILKNSDYNTKNFIRWAQNISIDHPNISSVQLAKDGIVSQVYPYNVHQKILGYDILKEEKKKKGSDFKYIKRSISILGPTKLTQNNKYAFIIRNPIFKKDGTFWGFSTILLYLDNLKNILDHYALKNNLKYKLSILNNKNGNPTIFESENFNNKNSTQEVSNFEQYNMKLEIFYQNPLIESIFLYFLAFFASLFIFLFINNYDKRIKQEEEKFKKLFLEHSAIMLQINPINGNIIDANKSALTFYGYSYEEILKLNINQIDINDDENIKERIDNIKNNTTNTFITTHKLQNKETKEVEVHVNHIYVGNMNTLFSIIFDVTDKIKLEKELIKTNKNLANIIEKRVKELREKDGLLIKQSKLAAMGEMIAMIAHQWRQPLTLLNTNFTKLKTLKEFNMLSDEKFNDSITKGEHTIKYLSDTIDDFRNFFKKDENISEEITLSKLISKSTKLFENDLKTNEIDLNINFKNNIEDKIITINSSRISQVFINLIKNAVDSIKEKDFIQKSIFIEVTESSKYLIFSFEDSGGGISKNIMDKIFEPYFSTKSKNGTGLGLYMSKMIIAEHFKGKLDVQNSEIGAKFIVKLNKGNLS